MAIGLLLLFAKQIKMIFLLITLMGYSLVFSPRPDGFSDILMGDLAFDSGIAFGLIGGHRWGQVLYYHILEVSEMIDSHF
jgi:hypothetical protein